MASQQQTDIKHLARLTEGEFEHTLAVLTAAYELRAPYAADIARRSLGSLSSLTDSLERSIQRARVLMATAEERAGQIAELVERHEGRRLPDPDEPGPTAYALVKPRCTDPCVALFHRHVLNAEQLQAGQEIAWVYYEITAVVMARTGQWWRGPRGGGSSNLGLELMSERAARLRHDVYLPWTNQMRIGEAMRRPLEGEEDRRQNLGLVLDVVVDGLALGRARRRRKLSYDRARRLLRNGLDLYVKLRADAAIQKSA